MPADSGHSKEKTEGSTIGSRTGQSPAKSRLRGACPVNSVTHRRRENGRGRRREIRAALPPVMTNQSAAGGPRRALQSHSASGYFLSRFGLPGCRFGGSGQRGQLRLLLVGITVHHYRRVGSALPCKLRVLAVHRQPRLRVPPALHPRIYPARRGSPLRDGRRREEVFVSGNRDVASGAIARGGSGGYNWSASPDYATNGLSLTFHSGDVYPQYGYNRGYGFPLRCIQEFALHRENLCFGRGRCASGNFKAGSLAIRVARGKRRKNFGLPQRRLGRSGPRGLRRFQLVGFAGHCSLRSSLAVRWGHRKFAEQYRPRLRVPPALHPRIYPARCEPLFQTKRRDREARRYDGRNFGLPQRQFGRGGRRERQWLQLVGITEQRSRRVEPDLRFRLCVLAGRLHRPRLRVPPALHPRVCPAQREPLFWSGQMCKREFQGRQPRNPSCRRQETQKLRAAAASARACWSARATTVTVGRHRRTMLPSG